MLHIGKVCIDTCLQINSSILAIVEHCLDLGVTIYLKICSYLNTSISLLPSFDTVSIFNRTVKLVDFSTFLKCF